MFGFFRRAKKLSFSREEKEIFLRAYWFASVLVIGALKRRNKLDELTGLGALRRSGIFDEAKERQEFYEVIAYASGCTLRVLRDDIQATLPEGSDQWYELHTSYLASMGIALAKVFGHDNDHESFISLVHDHYSGSNTSDRSDLLGEAIDNFWQSFPTADGAYQMRETDDAHIQGERFYVYRIGGLYKVTDPLKVITNAEMYRDIASSLYSPAFIEMSPRRLTRELRALHG